MNELTTIPQESLEAGDMSGLPKERQDRIVAIKDSMELTLGGTLNFGNEAGKNIREFSDSILQNVKVKDVPAIDGLLTEMVTNVEKIDTESLVNKHQTILEKVFRIDRVKNYLTKYEDVAEAMTKIEKKLTEAKFQLEKDIEICEKYREQNIQYINCLDDYIMAGTIRARELESELAQMKATIKDTDQLAVQEFNRNQEIYNRLTKKVYDLTMLREVAILNIPEITLIQQGDLRLCDKIQSSIDTAIPLWESQVVMAITLARQKTGVDMQECVTKLIDQTIKQNSDMIKTNTFAIAKQLEAGTIAEETIAYSGKNLIETINGIKKIREEGVKNREKATKKLAQLHEDIYAAATDNDKLIENKQ